MNKVIIMGRLTADPELKTTTGGNSVVNITVAIDRPRKVDGQPTADFINCVAWRQNADFISKYFRKGQMIAIEGSIQTRSYEDKSGAKRTAFEIIVESSEFCGSKPSVPTDTVTAEPTT